MNTHYILKISASIDAILESSNHNKFLVIRPQYFATLQENKSFGKVFDLNSLTFEFLKWTFPSLTHPLLQIGVSVKSQCKMANSMDAGEIARYEPFHLNLHYWKNSHLRV